MIHQRPYIAYSVGQRDCVTFIFFTITSANVDQV